MIRSSHGWSTLMPEDKRELLHAIVDGRATRGPLHVELDLTDRCNIDCYFCNQQDLRTSQQLSLECATRLIDTLAERGLRSVRMSGGGDPLFHREITQILQHLAKRGIVIDNVTTNGVALTPAVAAHLIEVEAREVVISLNAGSATDYARMMQVKPALFDTVIGNVSNLVAMRGSGSYPGITLQFLLDRENYSLLPQMYELGRRIGVDRIPVTPVLEISRNRVPESILLGADDAERLRPFFRAALEADRDRRLLEPSYVFNWGRWLEGLYQELSIPIPQPYAVAEAYDDRNGGCFFAWYSMVVTGNGDVRPCCLLLDPDYPVLGNVVRDSVDEVWNGAGYERMRAEMRDVLLSDSEAVFDAERFRWLRPQCVEKHACWLKNGQFRGDGEFYRALGESLDAERKK